LLSGANDQSIAIWDIQAKSFDSHGTQKMDPLLLLNYHNGAVEDVVWHKQHKNIFGTCSDDRTIALWDERFRHS
jgi:histone-binding protein RBBP4